MKCAFLLLPWLHEINQKSMVFDIQISVQPTIVLKAGHVLSSFWASVSLSVIADHHKPLHRARMSEATSRVPDTW